MDRTDEHALSVMTFALRVGEEMLESNVAVSEVEETLRRLVAAFGLSRCEAVVTLNVVTLCNLDVNAGTAPVTLVKVVDVGEPRLDRLAALEGITRRVERRSVTIAEATAEIDELDKAPPPYRRSVMSAASVAAAAALVVFAGGGLWGAVAAVVAAVVIAAVVNYVPHDRVPAVFILAGSAAVVVAVPTAFAAAGVPIALGPAIIGGLYPLLPGGLLVASVTDGMSGSPVSSIAKGLQALFAAVAVAFGAIAALSAVSYVDVGAVVAARSVPPLLAGASMTAAISVLAVSRALPLRFLPAVASIAAASWLVSQLPLGGPAGIPAATFAAAAVIGVGGQLAARFTATSAALFTTTAVYVLVPGATFYSAMVAFAAGDTPAGLELTVSALGIAVAIAAGVAAGASVGRVLPSPRARVQVFVHGAKRKVRGRRS